MLIILGHLLSMVPSEVQSRELPPLLPLLFEGFLWWKIEKVFKFCCLALETSDEGLVNSSLQTLMQLRDSKSVTVQAALADHIETLVDCFLKIVSAKLTLRYVSLKYNSNTAHSCFFSDHSIRLFF